MSNPVGAQRYGLGGGDAYYDAVKYGGYTGTREQFGRDQAEFAQNATAVAEAKEEVERNTQTVVNTAQTFTEETVPAAIQSVEEKGDTEEDRLELRTTELVEAVNTAGAVQVQAVRDEGTTQTGLVSGAGTAQVEAVEQAGSDQVDAVELAGSTQVENVNNTGTTQVGNVNQAGTTQVGNVNTAGATQVQAVEDKGEEVLNSIPADYTELSEEVDQLNNSVSEFQTIVGIIPSYSGTASINRTPTPTEVVRANLKAGVPYSITCSISDAQSTNVYCILWDSEGNNLTGNNPITAGNTQIVIQYTPDEDLTDAYVTMYIYAYIDTVTVSVVPNASNSIDQLQQDVEALQASVATLGDNIVVPAYYNSNNYLKNKLTNIISNTINGDGISFVFITDLHLKDNSKSSKSLVKYILDNTSVPFVLTGGDIPCAYSEVSGQEQAEIYEYVNEWSQWVEYWGSDRVFQLRGNHDYVLPSQTDADAHFKLQTKQVWQTVCGKTDRQVHGSAIGCFYYFDIPSQKIRFIIIDGHADNINYPKVVTAWFEPKQKAWLANVLKDSDDYNIIIVTHEAYNSDIPSYSTALSDLGVILSAYKNHGTYNVWDGTRWNDFDFADCTGIIDFVLSGHSHQDSFAIDENGILSVSTICDAYYNRDPEITRTVGTITESGFDVVFVDTTNKTLKTVRIGAGNNRAWNYETGAEL